MPTGLDHIQSFDDLGHHVHEVLCSHENLVAEQFAMKSVLLKQGDVACGIQFLLRGPRSVRLGAVWAAQPNLVYFYDARGERFLKQQLPQQIDIPADAHFLDGNAAEIAA